MARRSRSGSRARRYFKSNSIEAVIAVEVDPFLSTGQSPVSPRSPRARPQKAQDLRTPHPGHQQSPRRGKRETSSCWSSSPETRRPSSASPDYEAFLFAEKDAAVIDSIAAISRSAARAAPLPFPMLAQGITRPVHVTTCRLIRFVHDLLKPVPEGFLAEIPPAPDRRRCLVIDFSLGIRGPRFAPRTQARLPRLS